MTHSNRQAARSVVRVAREGRSALDRALDDLREVETLVGFLALLRDPAAKRPWREVVLDAFQRAELDDEARAELADRTEDAPGEHRDAARPDVLDALSGVLWRAQDLAAYVLRAVYHPALPEAGPAADPRPYLRAAREHLPTAVTGWTNGKDFAYFAADRAAAMLDDLEAALALNVDGHTVKAVCPWCRGGLAGSYSWRVRALPGSTTDLSLVVIVCESGVCNPPTKDVTTWWKGVPAWPFRDWPWLARRLARLDARRAALAPPPPVFPAVQGSTGRAGTASTPDAEAALLDGVPLTTDRTTDPEGTAA
ncbi:hypothetical protein [Actinomadura decatromicini]|uniref:Uncharacterized protein n=1 Tax=Actinomadura decatromicini TaxID=2604572 RepID=A0A5D3FFZ3_9ACTN|nr:hypothetical protein [Actinomadura decatromicini]TYK47171.1 hypothetical protein FXF68_25570 [Actinomadura decatromicini]